MAALQTGSLRDSEKTNYCRRVAIVPPSAPGAKPLGADSATSSAKLTLLPATTSTQEGRDMPSGDEVVIRPKPQLEPLPVLEGSIPEGWKDVIYDDPH